MARTVTASVTVNFGEGATGNGGYLSAKVISEGPHVHSEPVDIRCYRAPDTTIQRVIPTAGRVAEKGSGAESQKTTVTFVGSKETSIPKYAKEILGYRWMGHSPGNVTFDLEHGKAICSCQPENAFGVLEIEFTVLYQDYQLTGVPQDIKTVVVGFIGKLND